MQRKGEGGGGMLPVRVHSLALMVYVPVARARAWNCNATLLTAVSEKKLLFECCAFDCL